MRLTAVVVPDRALDRLVRACDLPFTLAPAGEVDDGALVPLESRSGSAIGLAIADRTAECWRLMTRAGDPWTSTGDAYLDARLDAALAWRRAAAVTGPEAAYRLVHGAGDALPGVYVDIYGPFAVASALTPALLPLAGAVARRLVTRTLAEGVVVKHRGRGSAAHGAQVVVEIVGQTPPERLVVREGPWRFEVHLSTGINVGLFGDMRAERLRLASLAGGRRVLNLFAYTGTLSVAAATGGAVHVTSVDLSEGVLAWARDNAALNDVPAERHRTVAADARRFATSAAASGEVFDLVMVDPPSFSPARDAAFAIDRDYSGLITDACRLVAPGGLAWLASNTRGFSLVGAAQAGTAAAGRRAQVLSVGLLPPDHPTELADAEARYLQTILLRLT